MKYLIFLRKRVGGGRTIAYFYDGFFHFGNRCVPSRDVKRSYRKK